MSPLFIKFEKKIYYLQANVAKFDDPTGAVTAISFSENGYFLAVCFTFVIKGGTYIKAGIGYNILRHFGRLLLMMVLDFMISVN